MEGPPVDGGALLVSGGRVRAVGRAGDLARQWPAAAREEHEGTALLPGLVNAHTHLELTALGEPPEGTDFVGWILEVIRRKRAASPELFAEGIRSGAARCAASGQAAVGDVLSVPEAAVAYPEQGPLVAVFPEVIAPHAGQVSGSLAAALGVHPAAQARLSGLSPHAPYTVGADAYLACGRAAAERGLRLMTHLAESPQELDFCLGGGGEVANRLYRSLGLSPPAAPGLHPLEWLDRLGLLGPRTILVHGTGLAAHHPDLLARRGAGVALCPRSNRRLGVGRAPGRALLDAGVTVGLGTDSLLSAGDLDLWRDVVAAVEDYGWSPEEAVRAATVGSASLLGLAGEMGRFAPGCRAAILALPLGTGRGLWDRVLEAAGPGRWVG